MNWNGDYLTLGPVPCDEDCAQVGSRDFRNQSRREMKAYINQLKREFPEWVGHDVAFKIMSFAHDFGSYGEVVIVIVPHCFGFCSQDILQSIWINV